MSMTAKLGTEGCWCPHCGEWLDREDFDQDDIRELEKEGDADFYYICPYCGESFYVTNYD